MLSYDLELKFVKKNRYNCRKTKNTLGRDMNEVQVYSGEGEGGRERACWWRARQSP